MGVLWTKTFSYDERQKWAVMDQHWYSAWPEGQHKACRLDLRRFLLHILTAALRWRQEDSVDGMYDTIAAQHIGYHDCGRPCHHRCPITCNCESISRQSGYILGSSQIRAENLAADHMVLQDRGQVCAIQQFFFSDTESLKERCERSVSWSKHCEGSWPTQRIHKSCLLKCLHEDCESAIANSRVDDTGRCRSRCRRQEDSIDGMDNTIAAQHIGYHDCGRPCHHRCPITCNCESISRQSGYIL